ncbi:MAG: SDR family oxidoreductase [Tenuifilaceae bacterium]|jgi:NAD(P)-dependent dehydrogenase (short-subunit alcohol dehydrogenase family)|nr:SDR family oxidoreductase [Tenuifilaceae bacterium]
MMAMNFEHLKNKTCVITGGGGVLGTSMADALASVGMKVVILDLNKEAAEKLAKQITDKYGVEALGLAANVLDKKSLEDAKKTINDKLGPIHYLVNGAGGNSPKATTKVEQLIPGKGDIWTESFYGLDLEGFRFVFDLNFLGTLLPTMVFTTDMLEAGKGGVINISSMNAIKPLTKIPAYSAAKSAINNFTEWLAVHLGKTGIRVNAIAPGFFLTNQNRFLLTDEKTGNLTPRGEKIISSTPMGKFGNPEDLSGTLLFLLSDLSEFITGIVVPVDGGFSAFGGV